MQMKKEKANFLNKKRGRISNNNKSIKGKHDKNSPDNMVKKLKVQIMKFLIILMNHIIGISNKKNNNLQLIDPDFTENVTKEYNIHFFNQKVYMILSLNSQNLIIIQNYYYLDQFNQILNMKLNDIIQTIFLMKSEDFKNKYSFENEFLFEFLKKKNENKKKKKNENEEFYKNMENILKKENSLLTYFEEIKGRELKKKNFYKEYYQLIEKNKKIFEEYKLIQKKITIEMIKEFDTMIEKENEKNLIQNLGLPLKEEHLFF